MMSSTRPTAFALARAMASSIDAGRAARFRGIARRSAPRSPPLRPPLTGHKPSRWRTAIRFATRRGDWAMAPDEQVARGALREIGVFDPANFRYRVPDELSGAPVVPRRVLLVASCLMIHWPAHIYTSDHGCHCDYVLFNHVAELPEAPPHPIAEYDLQMVQLPLRSIVWDGSFSALAYGEAQGYERLFGDACERLAVLLHAAMRWNEEHGILTFVANFFVPQQNNIGRLLPRYDLRNFQHFVERLNMFLEQEVRRYKNAFLFDIDVISATYGRRYFQDDVAWADNHGSLLNDVRIRRRSSPH